MEGDTIKDEMVAKEQSNEIKQHIEFLNAGKAQVMSRLISKRYGTGQL